MSSTVSATVPERPRQANSSLSHALVAIAIISFLIKCAMAYLTYGTNDASTWQMDVVKVSTQGVAALYRDGVQYVSRGHLSQAQVFSHPPSMIHMLLFFNVLAGLTGLPIQFWMRLFCAMADGLSLIVVWKIADRSPLLQISTKALMLLAASPISIMISGFHANTDPIMISLLLVSVYLVELSAPATAGVFFGLALSVKVVPVLCGLTLLLYLPCLKSRLRFLVVAVAVFAAAGLPYFALEPLVVLRAITSYNGQPWMAPVLLGAIGIGPAGHKIIFFLLLIAISIGMNIGRIRLPLFAQVGTIFAFFLAFAHGSAVQYFAWGVPWVLTLGIPATLSYYAVPGMFMAALYTHWSGGFRWNYADADSRGLGNAGGLLLLAAWITVFVIFVLYVRMVLRWQAPGRARERGDIDGGA
jgi:hypothetical protein